MPSGWSDADALLLRATDELHADSRIGDATWAALAEQWDDQQLIELCMVVGQYHLVAMTLNSLGVEPETDDFPCRCPAVTGRRSPGGQVLVSGPARRPSDDPDAPMGNGRAIAVSRARRRHRRVRRPRHRRRPTPPPTSSRPRAPPRTCSPPTWPTPRRAPGVVDAAAAAMDGLDGLVCNVGIGAGMGMQGTTARAVGPGVLGERAVALPAGVGAPCG